MKHRKYNHCSCLRTHLHKRSANNLPISRCCVRSCAGALATAPSRSSVARNTRPGGHPQQTAPNLSHAPQNRRKLCVTWLTSKSRRCRTTKLAHVSFAGRRPDSHMSELAGSELNAGTSSGQPCKNTSRRTSKCILLVPRYMPVAGYLGQ
jgi:hypothetical protein